MNDRRQSGEFDEPWGLIENLHENVEKRIFIEFMKIFLYIFVISVISFAIMRAICNSREQELIKGEEDKNREIEEIFEHQRLIIEKLQIQKKAIDQSALKLDLTEKEVDELGKQVEAIKNSVDYIQISQRQ